MNGETLSTTRDAAFAKFSACKPELVVLARLVGAPGQSLAQEALSQDLAGLLTSEALAATIDALVENGDISLGENVELTRQGGYAVKLALGAERIENWTRTKATKLPLLALGLDPSDPGIRRKFARPDCLKAAIIAVAYDLTPQSMTSTRAACSELVWRLVGSLFPQTMGNVPAQRLERFGPVERTLLSGLVGAKYETLFETVNAIASVAVGLENASIAGLRQRLIRIGTERAAHARS
jgi:hypothetical protein